MTTPLQPLSPPEAYDQSSSMWVDEAIWGHRLHDEQLPWMVFLEFLNVFHHEAGKGRAFEEPKGLNTLEYKAAHRLYLRNVLFNNPHLQEICLSFPTEKSRWDEWCRRMRVAKGLPNPRFDYLRQRFGSFDHFCDVVSLVRDTSLEMDSNKRWTSKFVFPYGMACLFEDLDSNAATNDRRFFGRTGEVLYLMFCRTQYKSSLLAVLADRLQKTDATWNVIIRSLQPVDGEEPYGSIRANAFLPYLSHPCFDRVAQDWLAVLRLSMPGFDVFPHLVNLIGLHLIEYQLGISSQILGQGLPVRLICEVVAPKKTLVREVSCNLYQENNLLPGQAVEHFISSLEASVEWQRALTENDAYEKCKKILSDKVRWQDDYDGPSDPAALMAALRQAAVRRHRQHVANVHRNYGRAIGLVSKRGTVKLRYAPTDMLLKTLLFANVEKRMELQQFLERLYGRYGLVFGDRQAEQVLAKDEFDRKGFQANARRLEQRLSSLGLLRRLSDGCAYVINPYYAEAK